MTASGSAIENKQLQAHSDSDSDSNETEVTKIFRLFEKIEQRFNSGQTLNQFIFETLIKFYEINIDKLSEINKTRLSELKILLKNMKATPQDPKLIGEVEAKVPLILNTTDKNILSFYEKDFEEDREQLTIVMNLVSRFTAETKQIGDFKESKSTLTKEKSEDIFGYIENQKRSNAFLWGLNLEKALPSEQIDQLIESLRESSIVYLRFNQDLSEDQAKRLLLNLKTMPKLWLLFFSGKKLSNEAAADFAKIGVEIRIKQKFQFTSLMGVDIGLNIYLINSPAFHKRWEIENYIQKFISLHDPKYHLAFSSDYFRNGSDLLSQILKLKDPLKEDMETLAIFLGNDKPLPSLELDLTRESESKWEPLIRLILVSGAPITKVSIGSRCSSQIVAAVFESLPYNKTIKNLNVFSPNEMDARPYINQIVEAVSSSEVLETLELSHCNFDAKEMNAIALAIVQNPVSKISHLNLQGNKCGDHISESFKELLATNKTLRVLNLGDNNLTDKTCVSLCVPLVDQNTTLTELSLFGNQFGDDGIGSLGVMLSQNSTLISLHANHWSGFGYSANAIHKFIAHLECNRSLEKCSIETDEKSILQAKINLILQKSRYVEAAILVFQASRQQHLFHGLSHSLLSHVLSFVSPCHVAIPEVKRCTTLIAQNITARDDKGGLIRQWKKTLSVEMASGQRTQMTIFKPWVVKTEVVEVKSDKGIVRRKEMGVW